MGKRKPKAEPDAKRSTGRPPTEFSQEHRDEARRLIGVCQYHSRAAQKLAGKFKFSVDTAYLLIKAVQEDIQREFREEGRDIAVGMFLFLESFMANEKLKPMERIVAAGHAMKLLGLKKLAAQTAGDPTDVNAYLATLAQKTVGGSLSQPADPPPSPPTEPSA